MCGLNEGPLQKEGQLESDQLVGDGVDVASMKGPSRRRGNVMKQSPRRRVPSLNEGPLQKEGQCSSLNSEPVAYSEPQ